MDIGQRPASLSGCWSSWVETDIDNVLRTEMDSGALHTRRRFTGISVAVQATVTLPAENYDDFMLWFRTYQRQGSIPTYVVNPQGEEVVYQWMGPPQISWVAGGNAFTANVAMYQGSWF